MLVEISLDPLKSLSPVGVGVGGLAVGVRGSAGGFVRVSQEVREGVERRNNGEQEQGADGDSCHDGSSQERCRCGSGKNHAEGINGKDMADAQIEHGENSHGQVKDCGQSQKDELTALSVDARKRHQQKQDEQAESALDEKDSRKEEPLPGAEDTTEEKRGAVLRNKQDIRPSIKIGLGSR